MDMYVWLCMYGYVCMAMYVWLCMYGYVCMAMYVWSCIHVYMAVYVKFQLQTPGYIDKDRAPQIKTTFKLV